jgi:[citrate (pro-3S)-lyase] ligase
MKKIGKQLIKGSMKNLLKRFLPRSARKSETPNGSDVQENVVFTNSCQFAQLGAYGTNSLEYLNDIGVKDISIFGIDERAILVYTQALVLGIHVVHFVSDKKFELYSPIDEKTIQFIHYSKIKEGQYPLVVCCDRIMFPVERMPASLRAKFYTHRELITYSLGKHTIISALEDLQARVPDVSIYLVRVANLFQIKDKSEYEKQLHMLLKIEDIPLVYENTLSSYVKSAEDFSEIVLRYYATLKYIQKNGVTLVEDSNQQGSIRFVNGGRFVVDVPESAESCVHVYGNCIANGEMMEDKHTLCSYMQKDLNNQNVHYEVINNVCGFGDNFDSIAKRIRYDNIRSGDKVVIAFHSFSTLLLDRYKDHYHILNLRSLFQRPHNYGEVFIDWLHYNPKGYEIIAQTIVEKLIESPKPKRADIQNKSNLAKSDLQDSEMPQLNEYISAIKSNAPKTGSIVMNCNPFTNGHKYLVEYAASRVDMLYIFCVEDDSSFFPFNDRIELIKRGTAHLKNVKVLPSGGFIISQRTFKEYSNKETLQDTVIDPSLDLNIFGKYIAPSLNISIRFAGEEPLDKVTLQYNEAMKKLLPRFGVDFEVIPRMEFGGQAISASRVRKLLSERKFDEIKEIVPISTWEYLKEHYE